MITLQDINGIIKDYGLYICLGIVAIILIIVVFLLVRNKSKKKNKDTQINDYTNSVIEACGGVDNISTCQARMSRLNLELINNELLDEQKLKEIGVERIIKMSKKTTLLTGEIAKIVEEEIIKQKGHK